MYEIDKLLGNTECSEFETIIITVPKGDNVVLELIDEVSETYKGRQINRRYYEIKHPQMVNKSVVIRDIIRSRHNVTLGKWKMINTPTTSDEVEKSLLEETVELCEILRIHTDLADETLFASLNQISEDYPAVNYAGTFREIFRAVCDEVYKYCSNKGIVFSALYTV